MAVENQIDHIAISRLWRMSLVHVRSYRGADVGSDHKLQIAKLQAKLAREKKKKMWEEVKETYQTTCEEVLGYSKRNHKSWLSDHTIGLEQEKWQIKLKLLQAKTRVKKQTLQEEYKEKQKEVKKSSRKD